MEGSRFGWNTIKKTETYSWVPSFSVSMTTTFSPMLDDGEEEEEEEEEEDEEEEVSGGRANGVLPGRRDLGVESKKKDDVPKK